MCKSKATNLTEPNSLFRAKFLNSTPIHLLKSYKNTVFDSFQNPSVHAEKWYHFSSCLSAGSFYFLYMFKIFEFESGMYILLPLGFKYF